MLFATTSNSAALVASSSAPPSAPLLSSSTDLAVSQGNSPAPHSSPAQLCESEGNSHSSNEAADNKTDDAAEVAALDWKLLHSLAMMCATVYKSGKAIREVYGKHTVVHKTTSPLRAFVVHNDAKKAQRLIIGGSLLPLPTTLDDDAREHYRLPELTKKLLAGISKILRKELVIELAGHALGGMVAILLADSLAQAGYKLSLVITFGQPRFRVLNTSPASQIRPLRVVARTDPAWQWFGTAAQYWHPGAELVLLPEADFYYVSAQPPASKSLSLSSSPKSPSPLAQRGTKSKEKSRRNTSSSPREGKKKKEKEKKDKEDKEEKKDKERNASTAKLDGSGAFKPSLEEGSASSKGLQQVQDLEGDHRMESYLRNLKAKVRGTPHRVTSLDATPVS